VLRSNTNTAAVIPRPKRHRVPTLRPAAVRASRREPSSTQESALPNAVDSTSSSSCGFDCRRLTFLIDIDQCVLGARGAVGPGPLLHVQTETFSYTTLFCNIALVIRFIKHRYCLREHSWRWLLDTPWARNEWDWAKHTIEPGSSGF